MKRATQWCLRAVAAVALAVPMWWMTLGLYGALPYGTAIRTSKWLWQAQPSRETVDRRLWYCTSRPIEPYLFRDYPYQTAERHLNPAS